MDGPQPVYHVSSKGFPAVEYMKVSKAFVKCVASFKKSCGKQDVGPQRPLI